MRYKPEFEEKIKAMDNREIIPLKTILNDKIFVLGLAQLVFWTVIFLIFVNFAYDLTDMNEIVYEANWNLLHGINPYGQDYYIQIFDYQYHHTYFPYGPFILLFYLPASLFPPQLATIGTMDFMPGFYITNTIFLFIIFYQFRRHQDHSYAFVFWVVLGPIMIITNIGSFLILPIMLSLCGYYNMKNTRSILYFGIGALVYQYLLMFFIFAFIYHLEFKRKKISRFLIPVLKWDKAKEILIVLIPVLIPVFIFLAWDIALGRITNILGDSFIGNFLFGQITRDYIDWTGPWAQGNAFLFMLSYPAIVYNLTGGDPNGLKIGLYATIVAGSIIVILATDLLIRKNVGKAYYYPIIALIAMLVTNITGMGHYWFLIIIPLMMFFRHRYEIFPRYRLEDDQEELK